MLSKKSTSSIKEMIRSSKKKATAGLATTAFFEKAKSLFPLDKGAEVATEHAWETYITNRVAAEKKFRGSKEKRSKTDEGEKDDEELEDDDDGEYGDFGEANVLDLIRCNMASLEDVMGLAGGILSKSFRVLSCDALFEEEDEPRTVTILTRIYSPTRPVYIDVHFQYHCRPRYYSVEWYYTLGFKIHNRPGTNDYHPSEIRKFEKGRFDRAYSGNGWRSIAYGFYDDCGDNDEKWVRIENAKFVLGEDDSKDVYEALWGPLDDIEGDDDGDKEMNRRIKMVYTVNVLMAAAGIGYDIAVDDDEKDVDGSVFMLEGLDDRWFGRGVRKACGFQLTEDPDNEKKGRAAQEEELKRNDYDEEYDSDEDGIYDEDEDEEDNYF